MRVLHVINGLATGGAEAVLYRLASYPSGVVHEVVCLQARDWYSERLEAQGITVHHLNCISPASAPKALIRLHNLIRHSGADIVQTWLYRSDILAGLAAKVAGVPVVWNIRCSSLNSLRTGTRLLAYAGGLLARWIPALIINCSAVSREIHRRIGYESAPVAVIPNGYDSSLFCPDAAARAIAREALGVDPHSFLVGSIGRWHPQKGYPVLFRALEILRDRGLPLRLILIGRDLDSSNQALLRLIEKCGCGDFVQSMGQRVDIPELARAVDLHVLASIGAEGFPNVVAETMLSGTPNVATTVGDAGHIVGDTGWAVAPRDAGQLADAIQQAYAEHASSPEQWAIRRDAARQRMVDNFSLKRMVEAYEDVWTQVIGRAPAQFHEKRQGAEPPQPIRLEPARKPLRIVHVINTLGLGGAESLLCRLVTRDAENRHIVVSLGAKGWYSASLEERGVPLHHLDMASMMSVPAAIRRLRRIVTESEADVVQCWMYRSNVFGGIIAKSIGKPVVWGVHHSTLSTLRRPSRALVRFSASIARWNPDFIIYCSNRSADTHRRVGFSAAPDQVVQNGYDASTFRPDEARRRKSREALNLSPSEFAIGTISRWHAEKDLGNLLTAARIARDRGVPFRCFLIGVGLDRDNAALAREIEHTGSGDVLTALGRRADVPDLARAIDLHVLASRTEAFPNVIGETMLSGVPNIVTDVGDSAMMVGETGWVVPPRDPERLADAIVEAYREWKDEPEVWQARRKTSRERIAERFSIDRMAKAYEEVWRRVAAGSPC
jgi:glycosyltransferase involved in cell wall biosynthesis